MRSIMSQESIHVKGRRCCLEKGTQHGEHPVQDGYSSLPVDLEQSQIELAETLIREDSLTDAKIGTAGSPARE
jgi:hypothetical protein